MYFRKKNGAFIMRERAMLITAKLCWMDGYEMKRVCVQRVYE